MFFVKITTMRKGYSIFLAAVTFVFLYGFSNVSLTDIETAIVEENYQKAEALTQQFIDSEPDKSSYNEALYYKGLSRLRLERYRQARETFNLLIAEYPKEALRDKAYMGLMDSFYLEGQYPEAAKVAKKLLNKSPQSEFLSMIYLKAARANLKCARWQKARIYLRKIIRRFPDSLEAHRARQLLEEKQYFTVQVGAFINRMRAEDLVSELNEEGEYAYIVETVGSRGQKFYRVRVGKMTTLRKAQKLKSKLSKLGYPTLIYP